MALQSSGAISISDLRGEFGGSTPDAISEYYRAGSLVPDTDVNSGIPTSGVIALSDFYSGSSDFQIVQGLRVAGPFTIRGFIHADDPTSSLGGPASPSQLFGSNIWKLYYLFSAPSETFVLNVQGTHPSDSFDSITPEDASILTAASAAFTQFGSPDTRAQWSWVGVSRPAVWDGSGTATYEFAP